MKNKPQTKGALLSAELAEGHRHSVLPAPGPQAPGTPSPAQGGLRELPAAVTSPVLNVLEAETRGSPSAFRRSCLPMLRVSVNPEQGARGGRWLAEPGRGWHLSATEMPSPVNHCACHHGRAGLAGRSLPRQHHPLVSVDVHLAEGTVPTGNVTDQGGLGVGAGNMVHTRHPRAWLGQDWAVASPLLQVQSQPQTQRRGQKPSCVTVSP